MERDCVAGLYQSLGRSAGAEFSSEDVSLLYRKVFHVPSDTDEAHAAMTKVAGGDDGWSCVGDNVLDVLLEMERDREKKKKLYWDLQLLNVGNLNTLQTIDSQVIIDPHVLDGLHQSTEANTLKKEAHNQSDSGSVQSCTFDAGALQEERLAGKNELNVRRLKRLKKVARQCWARLASEGVQSMLFPSCWQSQSPGVRGQAWGCIALPDILLLVEVKYDVVTHLLYTEMLQERYTLSVWESMLPWQQRKEEDDLEDLAEEALESGDMLSLAELPGAFRTYREHLGASLRNYPESRQQSWSAVSLLCELHTIRQQEKDALTVLGERLDGESLTLLCLHIRLATLRAQRERKSHSALLAARQSWETWPHVESPCRAEQAALWLHGEEEEQRGDFISVSPQQQAALQLLLLTHEQERKNLVKAIQGLSLEDLQEPGERVPPEEDRDKQAALRNDCMKRMKQIRAGLQSQSPQPHQPQMQGHTRNELAMWSQDQLEDCSLLLLTHLLELQEVHVSALLPALMDKSAQRVQALRDELQVQHDTNPLRLLLSDAPLTPGSVIASHQNHTEHSSSDQSAARHCGGGPADAPNCSGGPAGPLMVGVQAADGNDTQDVCTGCGALMEDLPYLEILCVSEPKSTAHLGAEGGVQVEDEGGAAKSPQSFEKQGSLITLAWSKPPEDDTESEAEAASSSAGELCEEACGENLKPGLLQSDPADHPDADQQCSTVEEMATDHQPVKGGAFAADTVQALHLLVEQHLSSGPTEEAAEAESERWDDGEQKYDPQATVDCSPAEREFSTMGREQAKEPVSAMERERTMRNLVDLQRKVEQRQQRDRERQLLRVQERLSIIQNRKAEEDLLGLKHTDRLRHLTQDLPQEDKNQQKTVVRERLDQLRRERSYVMQSKRDRNTAVLKELLGPVAVHSRETDDGAD